MPSVLVELFLGVLLVSQRGCSLGSETCLGNNVAQARVHVVCVLQKYSGRVQAPTVPSPIPGLTFQLSGRKGINFSCSQPCCLFTKDFPQHHEVRRLLPPCTPPHPQPRGTGAPGCRETVANFGWVQEKGNSSLLSMRETESRTSGPSVCRGRRGRNKRRKKNSSHCRDPP